jgi:hypothetical protein
MAAFVSLDSDEACVVEVEVDPAVTPVLTGAVVRPTRHGITPALHGHTLRFTVPAGACQLSVEANGIPWAVLMIFINPPEPVAPAGARIYGPGVHEVGVVELRSGDAVHIAGGAVVHGHFHARDAVGISITGHGIIDGSRAPGKLGTRPPHPRPHGIYDTLLRFENCRNVRLSGVTLVDSPSWAMPVRRCRDVHVDNVKIISWRENGDGIDIVASQQVLVERCFVRSWDDALVVKSYLYDPVSKQDLWAGSQVDWDAVRGRLVEPVVKDVHFRDCVIWLDRAQAIEIGKETGSASISGIVFSDIDIIHGFHLVAMEVHAGDRGDISDVLFRRIRCEDQRSMQLIRLQHHPTGWNAEPKLGQPIGTVTDIRFEDITVSGHLPPSFLSSGAPPALAPPGHGPVIDRILVRNLCADGRRIGSEAELGLVRDGPRLGQVSFV